MNDPLKLLADRVRTDPFFLAAPLTRYAQMNHLDDEALARQLGCPASTLTELFLCRNPDPQPPHFSRDVEQIAGRLGVDPDRLAEIVRTGQAFLHLASPATTNADVGYLMAARDREEEEKGKS